MIGYVPGDGLLHRAHPFTTLAVALVVAALGFLLRAPAGPLALLGAVSLLGLVARVPSVWKPALLAATPFWIFLFLLHGVLAGAPVRALALAARLTAIILVFLLVLATVQPARLADALVERGAPFWPAYLVAATLAAVPDLRRRAGLILEAQRCRGLRVQGSLMGRIRALGPLAVPLALSALSEVDDRAVALETRGLGRGAKRTPLAAPRDGPWNRVVRWALAASVAAAAVVRWL